MLKKRVLYYHTLRYLKPIQLRYQLHYRLRRFLPQKKYGQIPQSTTILKWVEGIPSNTTYLGKNRFRFLNLVKEFDTIDWNYSSFGKLWTYNLNYFEFLNQNNISEADGLFMIQQYIKNEKYRKDGLEPYPISLRIINWVKFLSQHQINNREINVLLYQDACRLRDNLEFHLLANHLLENGFALVFAGIYFNENVFLEVGKQIVQAELEEQVLEDGAHYELSPMYHQIILYRILDTYNFCASNSLALDLVPILSKKGTMMLGWLEEITWRDGNIPLVNDAAKNIAPATSQLVSYAQRLGMPSETRPLRECGYRRFHWNDFELLFDVGNIIPNYQPGHAHADTLQLLLQYQGKSLLVDTGISTYEKNEQRQLERSTISHNTVTVNGQNSSDVWGGFRVGKRAEVLIYEDGQHCIHASHNGYGTEHDRCITLMDDHILLEDSLGNAERKGLAHFHFHPNHNPIKDGRKVMAGGVCFEFQDEEAIQLATYDYAEEYNKACTAQKITFSFAGNHRVKIYPTKPTEK